MGSGIKGLKKGEIRDHSHGSLRNRCFQKPTRRERNWEGVKKKNLREGNLNKIGSECENKEQRKGVRRARKTPIPFLPTPPHFSPTFCSPQACACSVARPLFCLLVPSPPGKGNGCYAGEQSNRQNNFKRKKPLTSQRKIEAIFLALSA